MASALWNRPVVRSGYPPHFSVRTEEKPFYIGAARQLVQLLAEPRVLKWIVAGAGVFGGAFWITLLLT